MSFSPEKEPFAPPRARKSGLWTDTLKSGKSLSRKDSTSFIDNEKLRSLSPLSREESEDDIPLIPEIDEVQDEDFLGDIAEAPEETVVGLGTYCSPKSAPICDQNGSNRNHLTNDHRQQSLL
ncbi:intraflagellar transport 43 isoform X3 [Rhodnius prolixus]|uniref:intraflagellar transport 43 isoform X3 n=1 Tax=Rhodnius prolixus TaxID=13249 RepID=UPI003D18D7A8